MRMKKTVMLCRLALLCAAAIALSLLDGIFVPLLPPGAKAGLSNVPVMLSASTLGLFPTLVLVLFKATFAFMTRGAVSALLSFSGGLCSALLLWLLFRSSRRLGVFGISISGALTHSLAQLAASLLLYGTAVLAYTPVLILLALPSGALIAAILRASQMLFSRAVTHIKKGNNP